MRLDRNRHYDGGTDDGTIPTPQHEQGWTSGSDDETILIFPSSDRSVWHVARNGPKQESSMFGTQQTAVEWARSRGVRRILLDRNGDRTFTPLED